MDNRTEALAEDDRTKHATTQMSTTTPPWTRVGHRTQDIFNTTEATWTVGDMGGFSTQDVFNTTEATWTVGDMGGFSTQDVFNTTEATWTVGDMGGFSAQDVFNTTEATWTVGDMGGFSTQDVFNTTEATWTIGDMAGLSTQDVFNTTEATWMVGDMGGLSTQDVYSTTEATWTVGDMGGFSAQDVFNTTEATWTVGDMGGFSTQDVFNTTEATWTIGDMAGLSTQDVFNTTEATWMVGDMGGLSTQDVYSTTEATWTVGDMGGFSAQDVFNTTEATWTVGDMGGFSAQDVFNTTEATWTVADIGGLSTKDISNITDIDSISVDIIELSVTTLWMYIAVRLLWGVLAILGNGLTMFAVAKFERLQTCTNYFICSLGVCDLLAGLILPLMIIHELYPDSWTFVPFCLLEKTLNIISSGGNMANILFLSIDRYIYIAFPLRYHGLVTPLRVAIVLTISWALGLLITPLMVFFGHHLHIGMPCKFLIFLENWAKRTFIFPSFLLLFSLTIGFHAAIARIAHIQARRIQAQQQPYNTLDVAINQSTIKISRTLGTVLGVYMFSILPQSIIANVAAKNPHLVHLERFSTLFYWANTWVNPLIYAWRLKDFRIAFKKIFTGRGSFNEVPGMPA